MVPTDMSSMVPVGVADWLVHNYEIRLGPAAAVALWLQPACVEVTITTGTGSWD